MLNGSPARDEFSSRVGMAAGQLRSGPDCCMNQRSVIPAKAGIHFDHAEAVGLARKDVNAGNLHKSLWIPAFAGMTD